MNVNYEVLWACHDYTPTGARTWATEISWAFEDASLKGENSGLLTYPESESEEIMANVNEAISGALKCLAEYISQLSTEFVIIDVNFINTR